MTFDSQMKQDLHIDDTICKKVINIIAGKLLIYLSDLIYITYMFFVLNRNILFPWLDFVLSGKVL